MEIKKRVLSIKYGGQSYEIVYPTVKILKQYQDVFKNIGEDSSKAVEKTQDFLEVLGLPKEISDEFEVVDLVAITNEISGVKKN